MAIRTDIFSIDYSVSPRVIWIDIAFSIVSAIDLYDTVAHIHALSNSMDEPHIVDAEGLTVLDEDGNKVGLTVILINAVYAFEARFGPDWVICNMQGGNVVSFTDITRTTALYPRKPTAYVSADRTSSVSATMREQKALQYASFADAVHIDILNGVTGIDYNIGTPSNPVNNIPDAVTIANTPGNGFEELHIHGDLALGAGHNVDGFKIVGQNPNKTEITIESAALVDGCFFMESSIGGVFDGDAMLERCVINSIDYVQGRIYLCTIKGTITLFGDLRIYDCYDGHPGFGLIPTINMNGSGKNLIASNWRGQLKITNLTGANYVEIVLDGGDIILDTATVTNGFIQVSGIGHLRDELGNVLLTGSWNGVEIINDLVATETVASAVLDGIA